jgi:hypothetical protein
MRVSERPASIAHGPLSEPEPRDAFLARLERMSSEERLRGARHEFDRHQRAVWAARYPDEVPTLNGEAEWIAGSLADLE